MRIYLMTDLEGGARQLICVGAEKAVRRARQERFGLLPQHKPFRQVMVLRPRADRPLRYAVTEHPDSVIALLNTHGEQHPVESPEQLRELLVD
jgi:hypothetical protein